MIVPIVDLVKYLPRPHGQELLAEIIRSIRGAVLLHGQDIRTDTASFRMALGYPTRFTLHLSFRFGIIPAGIVYPAL